ncbi:MAG: rRNA m(3)U498 methyltransferase [Proteobacteria bacterium]|nr:rRNA m(3)U498 methyltransferase [Pseudomonadota bacterium]
METPRFYTRLALSPGARLELPEPVARHAVRVLRLTVGAEITLFDGRGGEYPATIEHIERERVTVHLGNWLLRECESPLQVTLIQAVQAGDKMDFTLQKAVELGVSAFYPVTSRRSVVRLSGDRAAKRVAHWQGVAAAACEQCGRNHIPTVGTLESVEQWLARPAPGTLRLMLAPDAKTVLPPNPPSLSIQLLVGAEGGLDPAEIIAAQSAGFIAVRLGPRILRTETAGPAALAAMQALWGDFLEG